MIKLFIGIAIGVVLTHYDVVPYVMAFFVESGARDTIVETLMNVK